MLSAFSYAVLVFTVLLTAVLTAARGLRRRELGERHTTKQAIQRLLNPLGATNKELLISRCKPNQRLIRAFALTNTFVSECPAVHDAFRQATGDLVREASRSWPRFIDIARQATKASLQPRSEHPGAPLHFDRIVQNATLRTILVGLLQVDLDMDQMSTLDVEDSAYLINKLWTASKSSSTVLDPADLSHLNQCLRRLIPDSTKYPNPLDFVVPAWETMWRVVATTVGHIEMDARREDIRAAMLEYVLDKQDFTSCPDNLGFSAIDCISEVLRLHPPSKRISRDTTLVRSPQFLRPLLQLLPYLKRFIPPTIEIADVQTYHLDEEIWGADVNDFNPGRRRSNGNLTSSLAFGYQPMGCVASRWAPMAASVIAASLLEAFDDETLYFNVGEKVGDREGWEDWTVIAL